jgi:hypothetical protein
LLDTNPFKSPGGDPNVSLKELIVELKKSGTLEGLITEHPCTSKLLLDSDLKDQHLKPTLIIKPQIRLYN